jgi:hypothetical protein
LPLRPLFPPLILRLTFQLAGVDAAQPQLIAGAPLILDASAAKATAVTINPPNGEIVRLAPQQDPGQPLRYTQTHDIGLYRIEVSHGPDRKRRTYAVNINPEETDLSYITADQLRRRMEPQRIVVCDGPDGVADAIQELRQGKSLGEFALLAVLLALVAESFLANRRVTTPTVE